MNLPVLFRTIDGTSQVTIATQYAMRCLHPLVWAQPPSTFLFLQKDIEPFDGASFAPDELLRPDDL
jgi:hypothetical protein